ncbi:MAG TPA: hypothetical protein VH333_15370 [Pseudonocardiaceae bacterium]|jgi:hypothetical protein|nr:hypothetical protein [Pseudonocardiaceae bacterium]
MRPRKRWLCQEQPAGVRTLDVLRHRDSEQITRSRLTVCQQPNGRFVMNEESEHTEQDVADELTRSVIEATTP